MMSITSQTSFATTAFLIITFHLANAFGQGVQGPQGFGAQQGLPANGPMPGGRSLPGVGGNPVQQGGAIPGGQELPGIDSIAVQQGQGVPGKLGRPPNNGIIPSVAEEGESNQSFAPALIRPMGAGNAAKAPVRRATKCEVHETTAAPERPSWGKAVSVDANDSPAAVVDTRPLPALCPHFTLDDDARITLDDLLCYKYNRFGARFCDRLCKDLHALGGRCKPNPCISRKRGQYHLDWNAYLRPHLICVCECPRPLTTIPPYITQTDSPITNEEPVADAQENTGIPE